MFSNFINTFTLKNQNNNKNISEIKEEIKIIFLGDPDVGKTTSLIKLLDPEQEVNITRSTIINFIQYKSHKDFNLIFYDLDRII